VTEIPEHLLARSRERRAALSGTETTGGEATAEAAAVTAETPKASAPVPATPQTVAGGGGSRGVDGPPRIADAPLPEMAPRPGPTRVKMPIWIIPVVAALPLWAILYIGAFGPRVKASANDPVVLGAALYVNNCATCHGSNGEGGVGPQLNGGEVLKVWPNLADHLKWVHTGGAPYIGGTIGATHITVPANNVMPAFAGSLTDEQIADVVCYERVTFGGGPETSANCPVGGSSSSAAGSSGATGTSGASGG
jgi:mono/diheme cytochrome c family protein